MPRFQKLLTGVTPDAPVDRVARQALSTRLAAVSHFLEEAVGGPEETEAVHQLRIWTRRAAAALRLFSPAVPKSRQKWIEKTLRKVRRQAGAVRDCDVHLARLQATGARLPRSVVRALRRQRRAARREFQALRRRLRSDGRLQRKAARLVDGIAWPKRHSSRQAPPFGLWCRQQLAPLGETFFALAADDLTADDRLHEFRIAGKRLRYALELAAPVLSPRACRQLYEELSTLQDRLGEICDHLTAIDQARNWIARAKKYGQRRKLRELLEQEEQRLHSSRRRFGRWWSEARRTSLHEQWAASEMGDLPA